MTRNYRAPYGAQHLAARGGTNHVARMVAEAQAVREQMPPAEHQQRLNEIKASLMKWTQRKEDRT